MPDVSVIIPAYNRRERLKQAIASCFDGNEALDIEVIVVDDGSTDGTQAWMESLDDERITYLRQENQGAPVARNRGLEEAQGEFLKFLDDDDWLTSGGLSEEVRVLSESGAGISSGNIRVLKEGQEEHVLETEPAPDLVSGIFKGAVTTHTHRFLYRREVAEEITWDPSLRYHQDTDFAVRVASTGVPAISVDHVVGILNRHEGLRITTQVKRGEPHAELIRRRVSTIEMGVERLKQHDPLQKHHRMAAAEGIWRWAHMSAAYDLKCFRDCMEVLQGIAPGFSPRRASVALSLMDEAMGPSITERFLFPFRWVKFQMTAR